ncbi:MAG: FkbM family methyltransferase [Bacteroidota bacterium]
MINKIFNRGKRKDNDGFYAQGKEDFLVVQLLNLERPGLYIDVGAHHPVKLSNTYYLYQSGWRGICIEPNEDLIERYKQNRPQDSIYNIAVSNFEGEADFYMGQYTVHASLQSNKNTELAKRQVPVRKLENILDEKGVTDIDFLSVDTEGTEVDVLEGLNLNRYRPKLILAEYNTSSSANLALQPYLLNNGYQLIFINTWNMLFSRDAENDLIQLYKNINLEIRPI